MFTHLQFWPWKKTNFSIFFTAKKDEVEFVPLENQGGEPIVDTGVIGGRPWIQPFDGLFESLAGMYSTVCFRIEFKNNKNLSKCYNSGAKTW